MVRPLQTTLPSQISPQAGVWDVDGVDNRLEATGTGIARADLDSVSGSDLPAPELSARVLPEPSNAGATLVGFEVAAGATTFRVGWQSRLVDFATVESRLVAQSVSGGVVTELDSSAWAADSAGTRRLAMTHYPDERLLVQATTADSTQTVEIEVSCVGIGSMPAADAWSLVVSGATAGQAISGSFDDIAWSAVPTRTHRHAVFNGFNQLLSEDEATEGVGAVESQATWAYDDHGRNNVHVRTSGGGSPSTTEYTYDALDRLTEVALAGQVTTYGYAAGTWLRTSATVSGMTTAFTYDGQSIASTTAGGVTTRYLNHAGKPLLETSGGAVGTYGRDPFGNVTSVISPSPLVGDPWAGQSVRLRAFGYDAFGRGSERMRVAVGGDASLQEQPTLTPGVRYRGMWFDGGEEGTYKTQTRSYDPSIGRFTQVDPARAGNNWYAYCGGDPVNRADPSGLDWVEADGGLVYWVFDDPSGNVLGRAPIATSSDGITADFSHSRINLAGHNNFNIQGLSAMARDVHLAYEQFPAAAVQQSIKQMASGTFYQGGFGGSVEEARSTWLNSRIVAADGLTFGLIDALHADANKVIAAKAQEGDWNGFVWGASRGLGNVSGAAGATAVVLATGGTVIQALPAAAAVPTTLLLNAPTVTTALAWTGSAAGLGFATKSGYDTVQSFANGDSAGAGQNFVTTLALLPAAKPGLVLAGRGANFTGGYVADAYRGMRLGQVVTNQVATVDAAIASGDIGAIMALGVSRNMAARLVGGGSGAARFRGSLIDKLSKAQAAQTWGLRSLNMPGNFQYGPDFWNPATKRAWDMTTPGQWAVHVDQYLLNPPLGKPTWNTLGPLFTTP